MDSVSPAVVKDLISRFGFRIKKRLGQNFLIDGNIIRKIVETVEPGPGDTVVEIGPGLGALTRSLAARTGWVIAVEIDRDLIPVLRETMAGLDNVQIVEADALKTDFDGLVRQAKREHPFEGLGTGTPLSSRRVRAPGAGNVPGWTGVEECPQRMEKGYAFRRGMSSTADAKASKYMVAANLPYYITTPLIMHLLEKHTYINRIVVMVQEEVARRLTARPDTPEYGALTLAANFYARTEMVFRVPRTVFIPRPEVDSAVVRLEVRDVPAVSVKDKNVFFSLVRAAFQQRRKTLLNAVSAVDKRMTKVVWLDVFQKAGIDPGRRGETLNLSEFARLADVYAGASAGLH